MLSWPAGTVRVPSRLVWIINNMNFAAAVAAAAAAADAWRIHRCEGSVKDELMTLASAVDTGGRWNVKSPSADSVDNPQS